MLPCNPGGHAAFQDTFVSQFLKFYPDPFALPKSTWDYIVQFWFLDLSKTDSSMQECYSVFGPEPRLPSCMLRSYLLALKLKVTSITVWCRMLKETPLYAILSGFSFGDTPGVGTFYDFFSRIWQDGSNNLSPKDRFPKMKKTPRGKKKGDKTPCDCKEKGCSSCNCKRHYSQPDCNWGWDSHRECYFFGYHLYMYVASDSFSGLPVFPLLERASRHDMLSFLHSFFTMKAYLPEFRIEKLLLDSAHDAYAVYDYCRREDITPFIGLNPGHTGHFTYKDDFTIDDDGVPVCKLGLRMHKDGYEAAKHRAKYRCPKSDRKRGCFCEHPCSPAKYGRTVHIFTDDNPRLFNIPPRDSEAWEKEYDRRTSVERSNKREKEDYKLEDGRHRFTKMWYCRLYGIMMLQHLDAWEMPSAEAFQESLLGFTA